jgi:eukaryotic-like serine/threonine-protein kinase
VPASIQPIVYRALAKVPSQRYPSAEEMLRDLERARTEFAATPNVPEEQTLTRAISARELRKYVEGASTPRWNAGQSKQSRRFLFGVAAIVLIGAALLLLPPVRQGLLGLAYAGSEKHIAVLPFENSGNDPDYELVGQGLMDSLTNELSNLDAAQQSLWVVPASVVRSHKVTDATAAFRELGATMVVQGRVRRQGSGVYLTVSLIDSKRLRQIGSAELEDASGNLAKLQSEAVTKLARLMRVRQSAASLASAGTAVPSSYESYLKALGYIQRFDKPGNLDNAISALNSAVQKDSSFALGYATLGETYRLKYQTEPPPRLARRGRRQLPKGN